MRYIEIAEGVLPTCATGPPDGRIVVVRLIGFPPPCNHASAMCFPGPDGISDGFPGVHLGRVAVRASGSFRVGKIDGINARYCRVVQRPDGYDYVFQ